MTIPKQRARRSEASREKLRLRRHHEMLTTARRIVTSEGVAALTMQRLADELDCAVGSIYRYFPSKNALIAEIQREAIDVIHASFLLSQSHLSDLVSRREVSPAVAALARPYCAAAFWLGAEDVFPNQIELSRRLFTDPSYEFTDEEAGRLLAATFRLLDQARDVFDSAAAAGSLREGSGMDRALILTSGATGVLLVSGLNRWDTELLDGKRLASEMVKALFLGWGADPSHLAVCEDLAAVLSEHGHLVPTATVGS